MVTFWTLLKESIIVQSLVTLMLIITVIILVLTGQPVPDIVANLTTLVIGFWFGTKVQHAANVAANERRATDLAERPVYHGR